MSNSSRRLIVIVKRRPYDEATWKRLLMAYAYAKYDRQKKIAESVGASEEAQ